MSKVCFQPIFRKEGDKLEENGEVLYKGSLRVQRSIFKRAFSGFAFRPSNLGLFGSSLQPGAREKKKKKKNGLAHGAYFGSCGGRYQAATWAGRSRTRALTFVRSPLSL